MADRSAVTLPNLSAAKPQSADVRVNHGVLRTSAHAAVVAGGDTDGTTYEVARLPSHARISKLSKVHHTALGAAAAFDLGLEEGSATNVLVSDGSLVSAGTKEAASAIAVADIGKPLWELAGLTKDPKTELSIVMTLTTAGTGGGTAVVDLVYIVD